MRDIQAGLHPDKTRVRIMIGETETGEELGQVDITADELEAFIKNLMATRAEMIPAVPMRLEPGRPIFSRSIFSPPVTAGVTKLLSGDAIYFAYRDPGCCWTALSFSIEETARIVASFAEATAIMQQRKKLIRP